MPERFGSPKEYAAYYKLLLTEHGRREFRWWLERENPDLYRRFLKEAKIDSLPKASGTPVASQLGSPPEDEPVMEVPTMGNEVLAGGAED